MLMAGYAQRSVFRSYSQLPAHDGALAFKVTWHGDLEFDILVDAVSKTISITRVLPGVTADIYTDFKKFVAAHREAGLPDHRRIEPGKASIRCANHNGRVSLTMIARDDDYEYALQRLIHLVHETFLIFLTNGKYRDYKIARLGADPDWG